MPGLSPVIMPWWGLPDIFPGYPVANDVVDVVAVPGEIPFSHWGIGPKNFRIALEIVGRRATRNSTQGCFYGSLVLLGGKQKHHYALFQGILYFFNCNCLSIPMLC